MWQDTVIAICQLAFLPAMWPTVRGNDKPAATTSILNAIIVSIIAFALGTLHLWLAFATSVMIGLTWTILAVQKLRRDRQVQPARVSAEDESSSLN